MFIILQEINIKIATHINRLITNVSTNVIYELAQLIQFCVWCTI